MNGNAAIELLCLVRWAAQGNPYAQGLLEEIARLYQAAGEPVPGLLAGYTQRQQEKT